MTCRGDLQKQMAALVAKAGANNLHFDAILPDDLRDQVQGLAELKRAQTYIKELEERESGLLVKQDALMKELEKKQMEVDNIPADSQAMMMDLHQAQRQIALYRGLSEDSENRARRYRDQLDSIVGQQQADTSAAEKIENLETQIEDQQVVINKLIDEHRKSEALYEQLRESEAKALKSKDEQLAKKRKEMAEKDKVLAELYQKLQETKTIRTTSAGTEFEMLDDVSDTESLIDTLPDDSLTLQEQNLDLLQQNLSLAQDNEALQIQYVTMKTKVSELMASYECTTMQSNKDEVFTAAVSEIKTLNRYYTAAFDVLNEFAKAFHATKAEVPSPSYISDQLDAANDALFGYVSVKRVVRMAADASSSGENQVALCKELDSLGASAADSMASLEVLSSGVWRFLAELSDDPKLLSQLNGVLCDAGRSSVVEICM